VPLRYVVLRHEGHGPDHFDLMIEPASGAGLATWRLAGWPPLPGIVAVDRLPDHRPHYLDYEGEISGGRGRVWRVERGTCGIGLGEAGCWCVKLSSGLSLALQEATNGSWRLTVQKAP
jgi:hypothetical protein